MKDVIKTELRIIDYFDGGTAEHQPTKENINPLPESFGRNLDTLEKARLWLTNPHNWHIGKLFIMKWDGLRCTVNEEHGRMLLANPQDDGLPWCAVYGQKKRRERGVRGEAMDDQVEPLESSE